MDLKRTLREETYVQGPRDEESGKAEAVNRFDPFSQRSCSGSKVSRHILMERSLARYQDV